MVTRTISMPYLGGTYGTIGNQQGCVRLTSSRMIWVYGQTNPNYIVANIIDVPGGITSSGTPVVTTTQLLTQGAITSTTNSMWNAVHRLNDSAFVIFNWITSGTINYWTVEIDSSNNMTVTDNGVIPNPYGGSLNNSIYDNNIIFAEVGDNTIVANYTGTGSYTSCWAMQKITYDTTAKKLSSPSTAGSSGLLQAANAYQVYSSTLTYTGLANGPNYGDWRVCKVPNQPLTMVTRHFNIASSYQPCGSVSVVFDQSGNVVMYPGQLPANAYNSSGAGFSEMIPLDGNRVLVTNNTAAIVYSVDYTNKVYSQLTSAQFSSVTSPDSYGRVPIGLNTDYWLLYSRAQLMTPSVANTRLKVIRRVDTSLIEQSAASNNNTGNGFALSAAPTTFANYYNKYPELINGKLFWWGFDATASGAVTKLSWTVMSLPAS